MKAKAPCGEPYDLRLWSGIWPAYTLDGYAGGMQFDGGALELGLTSMMLEILTKD